MPTFEVIRSDATVEYVFADWYKHHSATGWTFEQVGLAPSEPARAVVKRFRGDRVVLVTDLDRHRPRPPRVKVRRLHRECRRQDQLPGEPRQQTGARLSTEAGRSAEQVEPRNLPPLSTVSCLPAGGSIDLVDQLTQVTHPNP